MTKAKGFLLTVAAAAMGFTVSCSDSGGGDSGQNGSKITKSKISGVSQKGPFVEGSTATLYELNDNLVQTGKSFKDRILDSKGSFEIKSVELISPYTMLEASGFYRNENTGEISAAPITLFAIADIREKDNVNVNLLTHLEYYRVLNLVEGGSTVAKAKKQAQKEILAVFSINGDDFANSEDMSIFGTTEGDAALLAISVLLQGDLSEGEFSQRLTNFSQAIRSGGTWDNEVLKTAIADWVLQADLEAIKYNILGWGLSQNVPDFEKYVWVYWNYAYGLGGCSSANEGEVKKDNRNTYRICKSGNWEEATQLDYDTYKWSCSASNEWEIKAGDVSKTDYICKNGNWKKATEFDYDTYKWSCSASNEREIKAGDVSKTDYVCKNGSWKTPSYKDKYCLINDCKYFTDSRDKQRYAYVKIGEQTWMAENLNYNPGTGSLCLDFMNVKCEIYDRWYDWATTMAISASYNSSTYNASAKHRGICPEGWHIPNDSEWNVLMTAVGGDSIAGAKLKAKDSWEFNHDGFGYGTGTDDYGFSALPGGGGTITGSFYRAGYGGYWWSASEYSSYGAYSRSMTYDSEGASQNYYDKSAWFSVRCLQD